MAPSIKPAVRQQIIDALRDPLYRDNTNESIAKCFGCNEGTVRRIRNKMKDEARWLQKGKEEYVPVDRIRTEATTQARVTMDESAVKDYAEKWKRGKTPPPIVVFFDGSDYWPGDGFHRIASSRLVGKEKILAEVRMGGRDEAAAYAAGANTEHGVKRTPEDKRRAIEIVFTNPLCRDWPKTSIASHVDVGHQLVESVYQELLSRSVITLRETVKTKTGSTRPAKHNVKNKPSENGQSGADSASSDSPESPADPDDSMASNPDDGGEPSFEPDEIEGQTDGEAAASTPPQPERKPPEFTVEDVKHEPVAEPPKADPEIQFLESCPLFRGLSRKEWKRSGRTPVEWFAQSARRYYRGRERKKAYFDFHKANLHGGKDAGNCLDPLASEDLWWLKISHPRHWHDCLGDETGQCHRDCRTCKGFGFLISRED